MTKFLIEVQHDDDAVAQVQQVFLSSGSHCLTHADWGCKDGVHAARLILEVDSNEQARGILPPAQRHGARIVALNTFDEAVAQHRVGGAEKR